jgi:3-phosphoshikimate 1-carboxyvinyltransferase
MSAARSRANPGSHRRCTVRGEVHVPGDKSVSHRAIMLAAIADGTSRIEGFLEGEDTLATAAIFETHGRAHRECRCQHAHRAWRGHRRPAGARPARWIAATPAPGMRLLGGLARGQRFDSVLIGDGSLSRRPMRRVLDPLARMGASIRVARRVPAAEDRRRESPCTASPTHRTSRARR